MHESQRRAADDVERWVTAGLVSDALDVGAGLLRRTGIRPIGQSGAAAPDGSGAPGVAMPAS